MVLLEVMRASVPVIASRVGGLVEALGETPWLVPVGNDTAMVDAVKSMLKDADERNHWSSELRQAFERSGTIQASADQVLKIYRAEVS
jgi:glycosyltransferase involved in cell wall biosynthesis